MLVIQKLNLTEKSFGTFKNLMTCNVMSVGNEVAIKFRMSVTTGQNNHSEIS